MLPILNIRNHYYFSKAELEELALLRMFLDNAEFRKGLDYLTDQPDPEITKFSIVKKVHVLIFASKLGLAELSIITARNIFEGNLLDLHIDADKKYLMCYALTIFRGLHSDEANKQINVFAGDISEVPNSGGVSPNVLQLFTLS